MEDGEGETRSKEEVIKNEGVKGTLGKDSS